MKGQRVRIIGGKYKGRYGTIVADNGENSAIAFHEPNEVALRKPGDMRTTAKVYAVPAAALREVEVAYVNVSMQGGVE